MARLRDRVALAPDVVLQVIGEDALLLKLDREVVFSLNATGARVAQLISRQREVRDIVAALADEYDVPPEAIVSDVLALLEELARRQLVVVESRPTV